MSFFGFDTSLDRDSHKVSQDEDLAVYTYGEEGYDGLADALDEGLDDLNDETFGDTGAICMLSQLAFSSHLYRIRWLTKNHQ